MSDRYDVAAFRAGFPALAHGVAHFDGPGGTQTPRSVAEAVAAALTSPIANRGRVTAAERPAVGAGRGAGRGERAVGPVRPGHR